MSLARISFVVLFALAPFGCTGSNSNTNHYAGDGGECDGAACGCQSDYECGGKTPRCDKNSGSCQPCLPTSDNCPFGQHCVPFNTGFQCSATCRTDADCPKSDGGNAPSCCNGSCTDTAIDSLNCGGCGKGCPTPANATASCADSMCGIEKCTTGYADCDGNAQNGCEVNTGTDGENCGGCGKACAGGPNATPGCQQGTCALTCATGYADCDKNPGNGCEAAVASDANNCGACGNACGTTPNGVLGCQGGACAIVGCAPGYSDCDSQAKDGCEANTATDVANCGACGHACDAANAMNSCAMGTCVVGNCVDGYANCDGNDLNGCERQTATDPFNCGGCNIVCMAPNGAPACVNGACAIAGCNAGYADCDGDPTNGCEVKTSSDVSNCGACKNVCAAPANTSTSCNNGTCAIGACKFGFADCDNNPANGCEANLLSPNTCGACNVKCSAPPNATAGCNGGQCGVGMCVGLYGDCDKLATNGCEKSLASDTSNCGACGVVCAPQNTSGPLCLNGQCGYQSCNAGFADCDGNAANGCEASIASDPKNCGACKNACPVPANSVALCTNSACSVACQPGFANCDGNAANGCETSVYTDTANCGGCGTKCGAVPNGTSACASGVCTIGACNPGYANCNGTIGDGCETSTVANTSNCGSCGHVCSYANAQSECLNGQCGFLQCNTGYADCDNNQANGCEANLNADPKNCGACNKACPNGQSCIGGTCQTGCKVPNNAAVLSYNPQKMFGYCWYLSAAGRTCDAVCAAVGGTNQSNAAFAEPLATFPDDCTGGAAGQPSTWFFDNGNACGWSGPVGTTTGYHTLGHGYNGTAGITGYYGKCTTGVTPTGTGTFPADTNNDASRCIVCPCF